jgi:hypothetical protein
MSSDSGPVPDLCEEPADGIPLLGQRARHGPAGDLSLRILGVLEEVKDLSLEHGHGQRLALEALAEVPRHLGEVAQVPAVSEDEVLGEPRGAL